MINELANFLNNPLHQTMTLLFTIICLVIAFLVVILGVILCKSSGSIGIMISMVGLLGACLSGSIAEQLNKCILQPEINSKMQAIDNKYPYQLSITDSNDNIYFVFCKTKDSQNKVIKTMNTGNNPTIKTSGKTVTYINISQHIKNGTQVEKQIKEKYLLDIVKNNFN